MELGGGHEIGGEGTDARRLQRWEASCSREREGSSKEDGSHCESYEGSYWKIIDKALG